MDTGIACVFVAAPGQPLGPAIAVAAEAAEQHGIRTWWSVGDREIATTRDGRGHDPTLCLQRVARATTSLRIAPSGDLVAARSAALRAKQLATLAWFAGGRLEVGLDLADAPEVLIPPDAEPPAAIEDLVVDRLQAMRALWSQDRAAYAGTTVSFEGAIALPKPPGGRLPWHVRSTDTARVARVAQAAGPPDGWLHWHGDAAALERAAADVSASTGIDAAALRCTWFVDAARIGEAREVAERAGVDELVAIHDRVPEPADIAALVEGQPA